MKFLGNTDEYLQLQTLEKNSCMVLKEPIESSLSVLWFTSDGNKLIIDGRELSPFQEKKSDTNVSMSDFLIDTFM